MRINQVIDFLEHVRYAEGDLKVQSITGFWVRTISGERMIVPSVGNGESIDDIIRKRLNTHESA